MRDFETVRWYLDKRDDRAGWRALDRIEQRLHAAEEVIEAARAVMDVFDQEDWDAAIRLLDKALDELDKRDGSTAG